MHNSIFCPCACFSEGDAEKCGPCEDAKVIGICQSVHRVGDNAHKQTVQYLTNTTGSGCFRGGFCQSNGDRKEKACGYRHTSGEKCAQQIKKYDPFHITLFSLFLIGEGSHYKEQHKNRSNGPESADKKISEQGNHGNLRYRKSEYESDDQSADDSFNQTDLIPFFNKLFHFHHSCLLILSTGLV